jgi:hypothetical protein
MRQDMKNNFINIKLLTVIAIVVILLLSGCAGKNKSQGTDIKNEKTTTTTESSSDKPAPGSVQTIHFSKLIEMLPESPAGWTADDPEGGSYTIQSGSWSMASKTYKKGDTGRATVTIMDSAYYNVGLFQAWKGLVQMETSEGYFKTATVKGFPAFETYSKSSKEYGKYINIKDRFMVYIIAENNDKDVLNTLENSINYNAIGILS